MRRITTPSLRAELRLPQPKPMRRITTPSLRAEPRLSRRENKAETLWGKKKLNLPIADQGESRVTNKAETLWGKKKLNLPIADQGESGVSPNLTKYLFWSWTRLLMGCCISFGFARPPALSLLPLLMRACISCLDVACGVGVMKVAVLAWICSASKLWAYFHC